MNSSAERSPDSDQQPARPYVKHVDVRLDPEVLARIDALIPTMSTEWRQARRSDVLRRVILSGLNALEKQDAAAARVRTAARKRKAPRPVRRRAG